VVEKGKGRNEKELRQRTAKLPSTPLYGLSKKFTSQSQSPTNFTPHSYDPYHTSPLPKHFCLELPRYLPPVSPTPLFTHVCNRLLYTKVTVIDR